MCYKLVNQLNRSGTIVVVVDDNSDPPFESAEAASVIRTSRYSNNSVNLSTNWNIGLDYVDFMHRMYGYYPYDYVVAVLNDDLEVPPGFVAELGEAIFEHNVDVAFPDQFGRNASIVDKSPPGQCLDLTTRMTGYAFAIRGNSGLRANERLLWWYGDNSVEMQARAGRGTALVGGLRVDHHDPDGWTNRKSELAAQAGKDRETFKEIWGFYAF